MNDVSWQPFRWSPGSATGIGSLPGTDIIEAVKTVFGEVPDLPYLPELPARGPGADMIGRTAGLLVDLPVELYAARWRLTGRPGRDARRTADLRERDLDAVTDQAVDYTGPFKIQVAGPWTLASRLELRSGGPVLRDLAAVGDVTDSLAEGLRTALAELTSRVPGMQVVVQLDEPALPAVLAGRVPTASGLDVLPAVESSTAVQHLQMLTDTAGVPMILHCCASQPPVEVARQAKVAAVSLDLELVTELDPLGEALDAGVGLLAGAVPSRGSTLPTAAAAVERMRELWSRLGFSQDQLLGQVVLTQACGLAGATPEYARAALRAARDAARELAAG